MVEEPIFPLVAVREIVANALVHRDLSPNSEGQWVEIRINADRLIVTNPGGLRGISKEQLASASLAKNAVNPRLYDMAKRLHMSSGASVIEGEGGGVSEVYRQLERAGLPRPTFADNGVRFTAVLYGTPVSASAREASRSSEVRSAADAEQNTSEVAHVSGEPAQLPGARAEKVTKNGDVILGVLAEAGSLSFKRITEETGLTSGQVRYALRKLGDAGLVTQDGGWGNRDTTYDLESETV